MNPQLLTVNGPIAPVWELYLTLVFPIDIAVVFKEYELGASLAKTLYMFPSIWPLVLLSIENL